MISQDRSSHNMREQPREVSEKSPSRGHSGNNERQCLSNNAHCTINRGNVRSSSSCIALSFPAFLLRQDACPHAVQLSESRNPDANSEDDTLQDDSDEDVPRGAAIRAN